MAKSSEKVLLKFSEEFFLKLSTHTIKILGEILRETVIGVPKEIVIEFLKGLSENS